MAATNGRKPTAPGAWKTAHENTETVTMPSGNVAVLRQRISVFDLVRTGKADDEMLEALEQMQSGTLTDQRLGVRLQDLICEVMFVDPKIGEHDGELPVSAIDDVDSDFVVIRAFGGAPDLSFRNDGDSAEPGADRKDVRDDPVTTAGDSGRKPRGARDRQPARKKTAARSSSKSASGSR